jgi:DNA-directed RNA polymerase subunit RPC12/RpoP
MSDEIVRCPYCVLGSGFRPMSQQSKEQFVCLACGHMATHDNPYSNCTCARCREMNRLANRRRTSEDPRNRPVSDLPAGA